MSAMTPQISGVLIVCSTVGSGADQRKTSKLRVIGLFVGSEFPVQRASNAEMFPFADVIMKMSSFHRATTTLLNGYRFHDLEGNLQAIFNFDDDHDP